MLKNKKQKNKESKTKFSFKKAFKTFNKKNKSFFKKFGQAFKATGASNVYKNRKTVVKSIAFMFIPFLYAFIALWAFFDPLGNVNNLPIALVNQDVSAQGDNRTVNTDILNLKDKTPNKLGAYDIPINNVDVNGEPKDFHMYYFDDITTFENHQNDATFLTEIFLSKNFTSQWNNYTTAIWNILKDNFPNPINFLKALGGITQPKPEITLQASYKDNPIIAEINDFALGTLKNTVFENFFPVVATNAFFTAWGDDAIAHSLPNGNPDYTHFDTAISKILKLEQGKGITGAYDFIANFFPSLKSHQTDFDTNIKSIINNNDNATFNDVKKSESIYWQEHPLTDPVQFFDLNVNVIGHSKAPYGYGFAPFFICIGLWVGTLLLTFNFTRKKPSANTPFWANYLAKGAWMMIFGFLQATILTTSLLLLFNSPDIFARCWQFFLFMWFIALCFDLIVQAIAHMFRDHDIGRFLIIILLILQLTSSSGTFPVALSGGFFQIVSHFLPFTYAIKVFRQILIIPPVANVGIILTNVGILCLFVIVMFTLSFSVNWFYDFLDKRRTKSVKFQNKKKKFFWREQKDSTVEEIEHNEEL